MKVIKKCIYPGYKKRNSGRKNLNALLRLKNLNAGV